MLPFGFCSFSPERGEGWDEGDRFEADLEPSAALSQDLGEGAIGRMADQSGF